MSDFFWVGHVRSITIGKNKPEKHSICITNILDIWSRKAEFYVFPVWAAAIMNFRLQLGLDVFRSLTVLMLDPDNMVLLIGIVLLSIVGRQNTIVSMYVKKQSHKKQRTSHFRSWVNMIVFYVFFI